MNKRNRIVAVIVTATIIAVTIAFCAACGGKNDGEVTPVTPVEPNYEGMKFTPTGDGYAFTDYTGDAESLTVPSEYNGKAVIAIGGSAFRNGKNLVKLTLPDSITEIDDNAFFGCGNVSFNAYDNALYLGSEANPYAVLVKASDMTVSSCEIADTTKFIYASAFSGCSSLAAVTVPEGVVNIGERAFYNCAALSDLVLPSSLTKLGERAFYGCNAIRFRVYDNGSYLGNSENPYVALIKIESTNITSFSFNSAVKIIYNGAFSGCTGLSGIIFPLGIIDIGAKAFSGCINLEEVTLPEKLTVLSENVFYGCNKLNNLTLNAGLKRIETDALNGCKSLSRISLPDGLEYIGGDAFRGCEALISITIPKSVTTIKAWAFEECLYLNVYCKAASKPDGFEKGWDNCTLVSQCPVKWGV